MVRIRVDVKPTSLGEFEALAARLKSAPPELREDLRNRIRASGRPALTAVKAAARGIEMSGGPAGSTGLRDRIAAATRLTVRSSGIRFRVVERRVDPKYGRTLTAGSEGKTWRHPLFGDRNRWYPQTGSAWFYPTLRAHAPHFRRAVVQAMRDTLAKLGG